ncbi:MAG TPA: hypothetical protein VNH11_26785, partial [Pirellulales bacterium]|nr:hypothetical protein [Pirellulales bacterium]
MARRFQFSLKSLMAIVVVLGLAFFWLEKYLSEQRPIDWQPFSRAMLEEKLAAGSPILVIFDVKGTVEPALETPKVRRLLRSTGIVPMRT